MQGMPFLSRLVCCTAIKIAMHAHVIQAILFPVTCREEHGPHVWVGDLELTPPSAAFGEYSRQAGMSLGYYVHKSVCLHFCLQQSLLLCKSELPVLLKSVAVLPVLLGATFLLPCRDLHCCCFVRELCHVLEASEGYQPLQAAHTSPEVATVCCYRSAGVSLTCFCLPPHKLAFIKY